MPLDSGDPLYPAVSRPAGDFGEAAAPPAVDPILSVLRDPPSGSLAVLCTRPIHHVLEYARLYRIGELLGTRWPGAGLHLRMCSELDDPSVFERLPFDTVRGLPPADDRRGRSEVVAELKDFGTVIPLAAAGDWQEILRRAGARLTRPLPLSFRGRFFGSAAGEQAARAFQRAAAAGSPRWTVRPGAPWPVALPPAPRLLLHQARFHLGDALWLTPLLRALCRRFADAALTVVGPPAAAEILARNPAVGEFLPYPSGGGRGERRRILAALADRRFDAALFAFARRPESRWLARASAEMKVPHRVNLEYFDPDLDRRELFESATHEGWCFWNALASPRMLLHALDPLVGDDGGRVEDRRVEFRISAAWRRQAAAALAALGGGDDPFVVMTPGGRSSERWPPASFAGLARRLVREAGVHVLLEGAPDEAPLLSEIYRRAGAGTAARQIAVRRDPFGVLAAILERARLLVSGDSAPIHLAEATGTPTLYFAQLEKLVHSHPAGPASRALFDGVGNDLAGISVEQAMAAAGEILGGGDDQGL